MTACGTYAGFQHHRYRGEESCEPCLTASRKYMKDWRARNTDKLQGYKRTRGPRAKVESTPGQRREAHLKARYGLTLKGWSELFASQGNRCAACGGKQEHERKRPWQVDHDHLDPDGKLRGILCARCNRLIGQLGDQAAAVAVNLSRFLAYLANSGDSLSLEEVEKLVAAIRSRTAYQSDYAAPDRPPRPRHADSPET